MRSSSAAGGAGRDATVIFDLPGGAVSDEAAADLLLGLRLRAYKFDRYKSKKKIG